MHRWCLQGGKQKVLTHYVDHIFCPSLQVLPKKPSSLLAPYRTFRHSLKHRHRIGPSLKVHHTTRPPVKPAQRCTTPKSCTGRHSPTPKRRETQHTRKNEARTQQQIKSQEKSQKHIDRKVRWLSQLSKQKTLNDTVNAWVGFVYCTFFRDHFASYSRALVSFTDVAALSVAIVRCIPILRRNKYDS